MTNDTWPALPLDEWKDTYATLHMWTQVVGKITLALTAPVNHSWGIAMHVTARGLTTPLLTHGDRSFTIGFDFVDHRLVIAAADFLASFSRVINSNMHGIPVRFVAALVDRPMHVLIARPEYRTLADLRGRNIGTSSPGGVERKSPREPAGCPVRLIGPFKNCGLPDPDEARPVRRWSAMFSFASLRRKRLRHQEFPPGWLAAIERNVSAYRLLPAAGQRELLGHVRVFLAEKQFVGAGGLVVNDEMRATIAAQACIPLLNRPRDYYPRLSSLVVYAGEYLADVRDFGRGRTLHMDSLLFAALAGLMPVSTP